MIIEGLNPLSNTGAVGFPGRPLAGLTDDIDLSDMSIWEKLMTTYNSQRVFDLNLERAQRGLAPIPLSISAPSVNVGLNAQTQQTLIIGAAIIGALFLFGRKRK